MATEVARRLSAQIYIKIDGQPVQRTVPELLDDLIRATIESSVHLPDMATLWFQNVDLGVSEADSFKLGQELRIELGDRELKREVFVGEVTDIELDLHTSGQTPFIVRAYDRSHRLHRGRFTRAFKQMTDSDIAAKIAGELAFASDVEPTREVHEYVLQDNQSNWDFLQERAARLGFELQVRDKILVFRPPPSTPGESQPIHLTWGGELLSFRARMVTAGQVDEVRVRGWDPINKKAIEGSNKRARGTPEVGENRSGGEVASDAFHRDAGVLVAREHVYSQAQADALAQAAMDEFGTGFVTAEGVAMGDPRIRLGSKVTMENAGSQFRGTYVVTEVRHLYAPEGYRIEFKATGRRSTDLASLLMPAPRPTIHLLTGVVTNNKDDRDIGRVKVKLPVLGDDVESHWCRLVAAGAGPDRGVEYLPEVDDEVLVIGSDINHLYLLGGLWNAKDAPPQKNTQAVIGGRVDKRIIRSRTGHVILLDDGDSGGITIIDSTENNKIVINTSRNALEIAADGDIKLEAGGSIEILAGRAAKLEAGTELTAEAGTQLDLSGSAGAKLRSNTKADVTAPLVNMGQ